MLCEAKAIDKTIECGVVKTRAGATLRLKKFGRGQLIECVRARINPEHLRAVVCRALLQVDAVDLQLPPIRRQYAGKQPQQRRLAAPLIAKQQRHPRRDAGRKIFEERAPRVRKTKVVGLQDSKWRAGGMCDIFSLFFK